MLCREPFPQQGTDVAWAAGVDDSCATVDCRRLKLIQVQTRWALAADAAERGQVVGCQHTAVLVVCVCWHDDGGDRAW